VHPKNDKFMYKKFDTDVECETELDTLQKEHGLKLILKKTPSGKSSLVYSMSDPIIPLKAQGPK
jgi:hypothetical protein